jgi:hypothetical protein
MIDPGLGVRQGAEAERNRVGRDIRRRVLLSLLIVTPVGFSVKLYTGPGQAWVNNYAAGLVYEIFWCLALFLVWPRWSSTARIAAGVFLVTSLLEVLQLWHPWALEQVRATFLGRALIGTTFSWWDFPHYVLGCGLGWLWMRRIHGRQEARGCT